MTQLNKYIREEATTNVNAERPDDTEDPPFIETELKNVLEALNPKKAPGPDGFTEDICIAAIVEQKQIFLSLINKCLELSYFLKPWKEANIIALRKPG